MLVKKRWLVYRLAVILLVGALLASCLYAYFSGAWLTDTGRHVATYHTGVLDIDIATAGDKREEVAVKLLGGTKFSDDETDGDPLFNTMVLPVTVRLTNSGTVPLRGKLCLQLPAIGAAGWGEASTDNGILYMLLPDGMEAPPAPAEGRPPDYRGFILEQLTGCSLDSTYADFKTLLEAWNAAALTTYTASAWELQPKITQPPDKAAEAEYKEIHLLFWADYDQLIEHFGKEKFLSNAEQAASWCRFLIRLDMTQAEAPDEALASLPTP